MSQHCSINVIGGYAFSKAFSLAVTGRIVIPSCMELCNSAFMIKIAQRSGIYRLDSVSLISLFSICYELFSVSQRIIRPKYISGGVFLIPYHERHQDYSAAVVDVDLEPKCSSNELHIQILLVFL